MPGLLRRHPTACLLLLAALFLACNAVGLTLRHPSEIGSIDRARENIFVLATSAAGLVGIAAMAILFVWPVAARHATLIVVATGLAARLMVIGQPPLNSDDIYRYVWDGRVQAAGINPYRYLPVDPALAPLRDTVPGPTAIYPNINRATYAPTIYPPAAQAVFALVGLAHGGLWAMKAAMLAFDLVATGALLLILRAASRPMVQVVIWSWNPLVIWELSNGGHVDSIAVAFTGLALLAAIRARPGWAGTALGLAVITKFLPAAFFPALWRFRDRAAPGLNWRTPAAAALTILLGYAAYASAGRRVLGFLSGYAQEEGLETGSGFLILRVLEQAGPLPHAAGAIFLASSFLILAALSLWILSQPLPPGPVARADVIGPAAGMLAAVFLLLLSPHLPWYLTMLVIPAALTPARRLTQRGLSWTFPAWSVLWPTLVGPVLYLDFGRQQVWSAAFVSLPILPLLALDIWSRRSLATPDPRGA